MGETTKISWTDSTWNPVTGCTKVSPGCLNCYAKRISERFGRDWDRVQLHPERLDIPLHWKKPRRIFVCSVSDLFHPRVPIKFLWDVLDVMRKNSRHTFQVLTKRPGRMLLATEFFRGEWPANIWAGTSVESPKYLPRLDVLARVPAPVRFVSLEPFLEPLSLAHDLHCWFCRGGGTVDDGMAPGGTLNFHAHIQVPCPACGGHGRNVDWVIVGGESGPGHRPMGVAWVRDIQRQCQEAGIPLWVKQASHRFPGQQDDIPDSLWTIKEFPTLWDRPGPARLLGRELGKWDCR